MELLTASNFSEFIGFAFNFDCSVPRTFVAVPSFRQCERNRLAGSIHNLLTRGPEVPWLQLETTVLSTAGIGGLEFQRSAAHPIDGMMACPAPSDVAELL